MELSNADTGNWIGSGPPSLKVSQQQYREFQADHSRQEQWTQVQRETENRPSETKENVCFVNIDDLHELELFPVIVMKIFQIHSQTIEQSVSHQTTII